MLNVINFAWHHDVYLHSCRTRIWYWFNSSMEPTWFKTFTESITDLSWWKHQTLKFNQNQSSTTEYMHSLKDKSLKLYQSGPYQEWSIPGVVHTKSGPYQEWSIPGVVHTRSGPYQEWSIPGVVHTTTWQTFCRDIFKYVLSKDFSFQFNQNFNRINSYQSIWWEVIIGSGDGLAPNRCQTITWNNDDSVKWNVYVLLGPNELTHWGRDKVDAILQTTFSSAFL